MRSAAFSYLSAIFLSNEYCSNDLPASFPVIVSVKHLPYLNQRKPAIVFAGSLCAIILKPQKTRAYLYHASYFYFKSNKARLPFIYISYTRFGFQYL